MTRLRPIPVLRPGSRLPIAVAAFALVLLTAAVAVGQSFNEFPLPNRASQPNGIVTGPDGNLWITELAANQIGKVTTAGVFTEFAVPTTNSGPNGIVVGPDGNLWFTEFNAGKIGRVTTAGVFTEFPLPTAGSQPAAIEAGPDGNLWITEFNGNQIARMTTAGVATEFPIPTATSHPQSIVTGPDGNLWFSEGLTGKIGRITPAGVITEFPLASSTSFPEGMASGPDGNLWFTEFSANQIGRITTAGVITEFPIPTAGSQPDTIANGPDGNLWFTERSGNNIARITPAGVVTEFAIPTPGSGTVAVAAGPDGNMWFTERTANNVGQLTTGTLIVTNTNDSGTGSLRDAIIEANRSGAPMIRFAIPGAGVHTIQPVSGLPPLSVPATIDGYTQPGASANTSAVGTNAVLRIVIDGSLAGSVDGLTAAFEGGDVGSLAKGTRRILPKRVAKPQRTTAVGPTFRGLVIANFQGDGIIVFADGTHIEGCFIGTNAAGSVRAPNGGQGVYLGAAGIVGGSAPAQRNLISGNANLGLELSGDLSVIQGNLIGTDAAGTGGLPNAGGGVGVPFSSSNNVIGGSNGAGNVIAFNLGGGVIIACEDGCGTSDLISGNSIFSNQTKGISLDGTAAPIPNDACDADFGGNNQQNYPVLTGAGVGGGSIQIQGFLNSTASSVFTVEFFSSPACDASGFGQGKTFLGSLQVPTDATCVGAISVTIPSSAAIGDAITATATDANGNTSEFSACFTATPLAGSSTTALTSSPNPSAFGQSVTLTATVTGVGGSTPTGTVTFLDGANTLGTAPLDGSAVAVFSTSALTVGIHSMTAVYGGDDTFTGSTSPAVRQSVGQASTLTALMSSGNPSSPGQAVTFTAVVSPFTPAAGIPTGTVSFQDGATPLGAATLINGRGTLTTSGLSLGTHSITATYSGDATFQPSTSAPLSQVVGNCQKPLPVSDLTVTPSTAAPGDPYELRWTDVLGGQAGQYEVFLSTDGGASYHAIGYTNTNKFGGTPTQSAGTVLTFTVRAEPLCSTGTSKFSDPGNTATLTVTGPCAIPAAPAATIDKSNVGPGESFTLTWNATLPGGSSGPAGQYNVLQSVGGGAYASIGVTTSTTFSGTAPAVPQGTPVSLVVRAEPSCATSSAQFSAPSPAVSFVVAPACVAPGVPSDVTILPVGSLTGPPTPTDYLAISWTAPTTGGPVTRYGVRINGDEETSSSSVGTILLPRGERLDPITAFVRAYACSPELSGATAQSPTVSLLVTPPIANFSISSSPRVGVAMTFTDTSSPQATTWLWVFDDGGTDSRQAPSHTFTAAGSHTVYLIASNGAGSSTKSLTFAVTAASAASLAEPALMTESPFDASVPERRRARVRLSGEGTSWLRVSNREAFDTLLYLRFLDGAGNLARERSLTIPAESEASFDLGAYGLSGDWTLEIVGAQKFDARVVQARRPSPKEVRR